MSAIFLFQHCSPYNIYKSQRSFNCSKYFAVKVSPVGRTSCLVIFLGRYEIRVTHFFLNRRELTSNKLVNTFFTYIICTFNKKLVHAEKSKTTKRTLHVGHEFQMGLYGIEGIIHQVSV